MTSTTHELVECPFCGHGDSIIIGAYVTHCDFCGGSAPNGRWNTRVFPKWLRDKIEANSTHTKLSQDNVILPEVGERLIGYISALEWVLSLTPEDK